MDCRDNGIGLRRLAEPQPFAFERAPADFRISAQDWPVCVSPFAKYGPLLMFREDIEQNVTLSSRVLAESTAMYFDF